MINLGDKTIATSFINLTYFKFACGDENPLKFVKKTSNIMTMIVWENSFSLFLLYLRLLGAKWFHVEPRKTSFLMFFYHPGYFLFRFQA